MSQKLHNMNFSAVYQALIAKVERKGGRAESVHQVTSWLTGYEVSAILACLNRDLTYGDFFRQAPSYVPKRIAITGNPPSGQISGLACQGENSPAGPRKV